MSRDDPRLSDRAKAMYRLYQTGVGMREVGRRFGVSSVIVSRDFMRYGLKARERCSRGRGIRPMPPDFRTVAPGKSRNELRAIYHAGDRALFRWLDMAGIGTALLRSRPRPCPPDFAAIAPTMTCNALANHYRASRDAVARWARETGVAAMPRHVAPVKPAPRRKPAVRNDGYAGPKSAFVARLPHDPSREGQAADVLRRFAAVYRCTETGRADQRGDYWRYGNRVLTGDELVERAGRHGFDPDGWRRIPAHPQRQGMPQREGA